MPTIRRVRTDWSGLPGGPALTTTYFPSVMSAANAIAFMTAFWTSLNSRIANDGQWTVLADTELIDDATGNIIGVESGVLQSGAGTDAGAMLSIGTQGLLNLRTGIYIGGRELRGKLYVPVPTTNANDDGVPSAAYLAALQTAYNAGQVAGGGLPAVVYSPTNSTSRSSTAQSPSPYWARLRSRQR